MEALFRILRQGTQALKLILYHSQYNFVQDVEPDDSAVARITWVHVVIMLVVVFLLNILRIGFQLGAKKS